MRLFPIVLIELVLVSCAIIQPASAELKPRDQIDGALVTASDSGEVTYGFELDKECLQVSGSQDFACKLTADRKVNISTGVYNAFSGKDLETVWKEHDYKLFINERPVDLQAFGLVDVSHPTVGKIHYWIVVLVPSKVGEFVVHDSGTIGGEPIDPAQFILSASPDQTAGSPGAAAGLWCAYFAPAVEPIQNQAARRGHPKHSPYPG